MRTQVFLNVKSSAYLGLETIF